MRPQSFIILLQIYAKVMSEVLLTSSTDVRQHSEFLKHFRTKSDSRLDNLDALNHVELYKS